uniref:Talin central domain-containing protein n=1 Tax=Ditylenchus dipsaci TaxID=166011 RepID=A0A915EWA2_9BILA
MDFRKRSHDFRPDFYQRWKSECKFLEWKLRREPSPTYWGIAVKTEEVYYTNGYGPTHHQSVKNIESFSSSLTKAIDHLISVVEQSQKSVNQPIGQIHLPQMPGKSQEEQILWLFQVGSESVRERLGILVATVAQIIEWTSITGPRTDGQVTEAIESTPSTLVDLAACVRELASILPDKRLATELLQRTHKLLDVFSLFWKKLESQAKRSTFLSAASIRRNEAQMFYDLLNDRIQNIATSTANLVLQAKTIPAICPDAATKDKLCHQTSTIYQRVDSSNSSACSNLESPACQERVVESVQKVAFSIEEMLDTGNMCKGNFPDQQRTYEQLVNSAHFANNALHQLLKQIQS